MRLLCAFCAGLGGTGVLTALESAATLLLLYAVVTAAGRHPIPEANPDNIPVADCFPWNNPALDGGVAAPLNHIKLLEVWWRFSFTAAPGIQLTSPNSSLS